MILEMVCYKSQSSASLYGPHTNSTTAVPICSRCDNWQHRLKMRKMPNYLKSICKETEQYWGHIICKVVAPVSRTVVEVESYYSCSLPPQDKKGACIESACYTSSIWCNRLRWPGRLHVVTMYADPTNSKHSTAKQWT